MIKINLCPIDEIENQYWYALDLAAAAVIAILAFCGTQYYFGSLQDQIEAAQAEVVSLDENTAKLLPDLERFKNLGRDIDELNSKLHALQTITVSKIAKYKPVIVLEHLQNLKPEGVWFDSLRIGTSDAKTPGAAPPQGGDGQGGDDSDAFEVKGQAFDNILTAEFMTAIRSTQSQEMDTSDLRTQVFFAELNLIDATIQKNSSGHLFPELAIYPEFSLRGHFQERQTPAVAAKPPGSGPAKRAPVIAPASAQLTQPLKKLKQAAGPTHREQRF